MIITELTPNPDSLKFLSEKIISTIGTEEFQKKDFNKIQNEFVKNLLNLKGVELVLLADNFLSVKKNKEISWDTLKPTVISHMNDYFEKNENPILSKKNDANNIKLNLGEVEDRIIKVLDEKIRELLCDKNYLGKVLKEGTEKARKIAEDNLREIRSAVGFF